MAPNKAFAALAAHSTHVLLGELLFLTVEKKNLLLSFSGIGKLSAEAHNDVSAFHFAPKYSSKVSRSVA